MLRIIFITLLSLTLFACASTKNYAELQQGKRYFDAGYYKHAMRQLLPLASDGNAEAQYGIGYMYYYGYGVAQDTFVGAFWIQKAANQHYLPAVKALEIIDNP